MIITKMAQRIFIVALCVVCLAATPLQTNHFGVSPWVMSVVLQAEQNWQASLGPVRGNVKLLQDEIAYTNPEMAWKNNNSLSRFNIRPSTAYKAIRWAHGAGMPINFPAAPLPEQVVGYIMNPSTDAKLAEIILNQLRDDHPILRQKSWAEIEASDEMIAKLYSGYTGAGNAWDDWRRDIKPGSVSIQRLGCERLETLRLACRLVQQKRSSSSG